MANYCILWAGGNFGIDWGVCQKSNVGYGVEVLQVSCNVIARIPKHHVFLSILQHGKNIRSFMTFCGI
jgi:hypothetical protein